MPPCKKEQKSPPMPEALQWAAPTKTLGNCRKCRIYRQYAEGSAHQPVSTQCRWNGEDAEEIISKLDSNKEGRAIAPFCAETVRKKPPKRRRKAKVPSCQNRRSRCQTMTFVGGGGFPHRKTAQDARIAAELRAKRLAL